jgi:hypothetical protein
MRLRGAAFGVLAALALLLVIAMPTARTSAQPVPCVTTLPVPIGDCPTSATPAPSASTTFSPAPPPSTVAPTSTPPTVTSTTEPATTTDPVVTFSPAATGDAGLGGFNAGSGTSTAPATASPNPSPSLAPSTSPSGAPQRVAAPVYNGPLQLGGLLPIITMTLLAVALSLPLAAAHARRQLAGTTALTISDPTASGGSTMPTTSRRWRLILAAICLGGAALVGVIGWIKISGDRFINEQIPYLASSGMAVVVLAAAGGALLVAEQLRSDDRRLEELEGAVRSLADALATQIESPPRLAPVAPTKKK